MTPPGHYHIAMLLLPGFNASAAFAFLDPFRAANYIRGENLYRWSLLSPDGDSVVASNRATISNTEAMAGQQEPWDLVVVNSSWAPERFQGRSLKHWLVAASRNGSNLAGIDTGAFVLAYAGLLDGYRATVHYEHHAAFSELFPQVNTEQTLYVDDRDRLTCSGGMASVDLALSVVRRQHSLELANSAAVYIFKDRHRSGNELQVQHSPEPVGYTMPATLREAIILMERNLEEPLRPVEIASYLAISQRQLERIFKRHTGLSPIRYYLNLRLDRARGLITQTEMSIAQVAAACGFGTPEHFSRTYSGHFKLSPSQDRIEGRVPFQFRSFPAHIGA